MSATAVPPSPEYFQKISQNYVRSTGNSTHDVFTSFLPELTPHITSTSVIHDNACGTGTASLALLASDAHLARIDTTDFSPGMIDALKSEVSTKHLSTIHPQVMDSQKLDFPDNHFDVSITNISVATFKDPVSGLCEIYRTLKPGGIAVVSHWKRFTVVNLIHRAQRAIRADTKLMNLPGPEYMEDGHLRDKMKDVGFADVQQYAERIIVKGELMDGLREFMLGPLTASAREGWSESENERWIDEIGKGMKEEVEQFGGIMMEAWFVTGQKRDAKGAH